jgi:hypothetical protein
MIMRWPTPITATRRTRPTISACHDSRGLNDKLSVMSPVWPLPYWEAFFYRPYFPATLIRVDSDTGLGVWQ